MIKSYGTIIPAIKKGLMQRRTNDKKNFFKYMPLATGGQVKPFLLSLSLASSPPFTRMQRFNRVNKFTAVFDDWMRFF